MRTGSYLAIFAITMSVTLVALALAMGAIYVIQTPTIFWNNASSTFLMILLITFPTALLVSKMSFDMFFLKRRLSYVVKYDDLTGTLKKEEFLKDLRKAKLLDEGMALMLDVDNLSAIVDEFGYEATDDILKSVADTMKTAVRDDDKVCRLGFEKFMVVLDSVSLEDGITVARRIQSTIASDPVTSGNYLIPISVSIGAVSIEQNSDIDQILEKASEELTQAKANGANRLSFESNAPYAQANETDLRPGRVIN